MPSKYEIAAAFDTWSQRVQQAMGEAAPAWERDISSFVTPDASGSALRAGLSIIEEKGLPEVSAAVVGAGTLVVNVGSRLQPALLSVAAHKPACLVLASSETDAGRESQRKVQGVLGRVLEQLPEVRVVNYAHEDPVSAWKALSGALEDAPQPVVVDITGGKKSMSAAVFFLAIERQIAVVYLDGERYDSHLSRPHPSSLRLHNIPDPAVALALREHQKAETLWKELSFSQVVPLLRELAELRPGRREHYLDAARYAEGCLLWSEARFSEVAEAFDEIGEEIPALIQPLCQQWASLGEHTWSPESGKSSGGKPIPKLRDEKLREEPGLLVRYLIDAWRWLDWQPIDARIAFLRCFALGEYMLEGLFWSALQNNAVLTTREGLDEFTAKKIESTQRSGHWELSNQPLAMLLGGSSKTTKRLKIKLEGWARLDEIKPWYTREDWRTLRNKAAHNIGEVSPEQVAEVREACGKLLLAGAARLRTLGAAVPDDKTIERWMGESAEEGLVALSAFVTLDT